MLSHPLVRQREIVVGGLLSFLAMVATDISALIMAILIAFAVFDLPTLESLHVNDGGI